MSHMSNHHKVATKHVISIFSSFHKHTYTLNPTSKVKKKVLVLFGYLI